MEEGEASALVLVDDGEGGAGDPAGVTQPPGQSPGEGRLAHAQAAPVGHHRAGGEDGGQPFPQGFRVPLAAGDVFHKGTAFQRVRS